MNRPFDYKTGTSPLSLVPSTLCQPTTIFTINCSKRYLFNSKEVKLSDQIANVCFEHYSKLGQRGKPSLSTEWTLLSAIVQSSENILSVVSMATGTKCIGRNAMSPRGDIINDSHAEVLARRCFLRYLYDQVKKIKENGSSDIFSGYNNNGKCLLRSNVEFILFTSHVPCGDASIISKAIDNKKRKFAFSECNKPKSKKMYVSDENEKVNSHNSYTDSIKNVDKISAVKENLKNNDVNSVLSNDIGEVMDVYRTGAKCFGDKEDLKLPGVGYHILGAIRMKPGRGDPTLSVSCSDKIARWITVGLQGACLSHLIDGPILLKHIIVAAGGPYSHTALQRALITRTQCINSPEISQSTLVFEHSRYKASTEAKPCPTCIMWSKVANKSLEIGVDGRRQGTTKKAFDKGRLMISKLELLMMFLSLTEGKFKEMTYRQIKDIAVEYQTNWRHIKEKFGVWTMKPKELTEFKA